MRGSSGPGVLGGFARESLLSERNDITVVEPADPAGIPGLAGARLDLRGVTGDGIQPSVLEAAGARDADMFIAFAQRVTKPIWWPARWPTTVLAFRPPLPAAFAGVCTRRPAAVGGFAVNHVCARSGGQVHPATWWTTRRPCRC